MSKVDPRKINGQNAQSYMNALEGIRPEFTPDSPYVMYIPFIVWLDKVCEIVSITIREKKEEDQVNEVCSPAFCVLILFVGSCSYDRLFGTTRRPLRSSRYKWDFVTCWACAMRSSEKQKSILSWLAT